MSKAPNVTAQLSHIDRFLPLWIFVAMGLGIALGRLYPAVGPLLDTVKVGGVSLPIAVGLFWMMYPVLA
ncbi:MAG TPA: arsenical-resistance protein, partial [Labilithrix sp.]|nr:arsenical-resistance protein [Labilithrix sp.]